MKLVYNSLFYQAYMVLVKKNIRIDQINFNNIRYKKIDAVLLPLDGCAAHTSI